MTFEPANCPASYHSKPQSLVTHPSPLFVERRVFFRSRGGGSVYNCLRHPNLKRILVNLRLICFVILVFGSSVIAYAESDEALSLKIVGHWEYKLIELYFYSDHRVKYVNIKSGMETTENGTWGIKKGYLTISTWPKMLKTRVSFPVINENDPEHREMVLRMTDKYGDDDWDRAEDQKP
jgi:hypothetical protein